MLSSEPTRLESKLPSPEVIHQGPNGPHTKDRKRVVKLPPQARGEIAAHPPFSHPSTRTGSRIAADTGRWELCGKGNMDEERNTLKSSQHGSH